MSFYKNGYVVRRTNTGKGSPLKVCEVRDWYFIKWFNDASAGVFIGPVSFPREFVGKKVRFKIEVLE